MPQEERNPGFGEDNRRYRERHKERRRREAARQATDFDKARKGVWQSGIASRRFLGPVQDSPIENILGGGGGRFTNNYYGQLFQTEDAGFGGHERHVVFDQEGLGELSLTFSDREDPYLAGLGAGGTTSDTYTQDNTGQRWYDTSQEFGGYKDRNVPGKRKWNLNKKVRAALREVERERVSNIVQSFLRGE